MLDSTHGTTSDFWTKFAQNYLNDKTFEKINIEIVINIIMCPCTKFQSIWKTSYFETKLAQKI